MRPTRKQRRPARRRSVVTSILNFALPLKPPPVAVETLAAETVRFGLQGRVAGSHLTSMHSMDNYYVSKLLPLMAEAQMAAIPNPLINITLQGRMDTYPKRRGLTRVKEMRAYDGLNVDDCVGSDEGAPCSRRR